MRTRSDINTLLAEFAALGLLLAIRWVGEGRVPDYRVAAVSPPPDAGSAGREAGGPSDLGRAGWWAVLKRLVTRISDNRLTSEAAGVTFFALLAIFPALAAIVSLYGLIADPQTINAHVDALNGFIPGGGLDIITDQLRRLTSNGASKLGVGALVGLLAALWSANQGSKALFEALNVVYGEKEKRGFFMRIAVSLAFTVGAVVFILLMLGAILVIPVALDYIGISSTADMLVRVGRWPAVFVILAFFLSCLYRFGPSRREPRWQWVSWGGCAAALGWIAVSLGFSWYVEHFGNYNKTYGSLGAAIGFMTWIWLSTTVMLVGGQLNAELEVQTARDTTVGDERPLGVRGARKADAVA